MSGALYELCEVWKQYSKNFRWTQFEDLELFEKFMQHGAKWVQIGK